MTEDSEDFVDGEELEVQIGKHDVDASSIVFGEEESEFIEFELQAKSVFKTLAEDIYTSPSAGIREPITNSTTAILRAMENYELTEEQAVIEITLNKKSSGATLIIQDNGIGISEKELRKVMAVIGNSLSRDVPTLAGQFGLGFLAIWMLVGTEGGFVMHTHSRKPEAPPLSGVWKSGGFAKDSEGVLDRFEENQYGTRFEIPLRESISPEDVRDWVEEYARWCRVSVIYREFDSSGKEIFNEDYGKRKIEDTYGENTPRVVIENEYFRAVTSPESSGETILLDVPVTAHKPDYISRLPYRKMDIRLKKENSIIIKGPNEGKMVTTKNDYNTMDKERREKYIPDTEVDEEDIIMPGPVGTRDHLEKSDGFWKYVHDQLWNAFVERAASTLKQANNIQELLDFKKKELKIVFRALSLLPTNNDKSFQEVVEDNLSVSLSPSFCDSLRLLRTDVSYAPRGNEDITRKSGREKLPVWEVLHKSSHGERKGTVYMGVSLNIEKARVVWEDNEYNQVVRVKSTDSYEIFSEKLGWELLRDIDKNTIQNFDVSQSLREEFAETDKKSKSEIRENPGEKILTIHFGRGNSSTFRITASSLKEQFEGTSEEKIIEMGTYTPTKIIVFPTNYEQNISDYYWMTCDKIGLVKAPVSVWDFLKGTQSILHFEKYLEEAKQSKFVTQKGILQGKDVIEGPPVVFHLLPDKMQSVFSRDEIIQRAYEYIKHEKFEDEDFKTEDMDFFHYAPITESKLHELRPLLEGEYLIIGEKRQYGIGQILPLKNEFQLYAYSRLPKWEDSTEVEILRSLDQKLTEGGYELIETLGQLHDNDEEPYSIRNS